MAKLLDITKLDVSAISYDERRFAVGFEYAGARYHWWSSDKIALAHQGTLYKNPAQREDGTYPKSLDEGYFQTRKLDPDSKQNQALMARVRSMVIEQGLVEAALIEHRAKEAQAKLERDQASWVARVGGAGMSLRESLAALIGALQAAYSSNPEMIVPDDLHKAWAGASAILATLGECPQ